MTFPKPIIHFTYIVHRRFFDIGTYITPH